MTLVMRTKSCYDTGDDVCYPCYAGYDDGDGDDNDDGDDTLATPVPALCRQSLRPGKEKYLNTENLRHIKMIL